VIFYGSHARGTAHEYSDIDVAVLVDRIEPVLRDGGHDPSALTAEILRTGHVVYSAA
jgi:predicted nucleotidyltransferase